MKKCSMCKEVKSLDDFYKRSASLDGHQNHCKSCARKHKADWIKQNRDKVAVNNIWTKYRIRKEDFDLLWEEQEGACALCDIYFTQNNPPHVDHCHLTGRVRGLLCGRCNKALGFYEYMKEFGPIVEDYLKE